MSRKLVVALLGAPGAGKGTQAELLAQQHGYAHLSTGDVLREAVRKGTALGVKVKQVMEAGELVSDDLVSEIVRERVASADAEGVFLLDGYPRNVAQARYLDSLDNQVSVFVINIDLDEGDAVKRLAGRRFCSQCGKIYNVFFSPSRRESICDACGGELQPRKDDAEEVVRERFRVYREQTAPVAAYYEGRPNYFRVNGNRDPEAIAADMSELVGSLERRRFDGVV